MVRQKDHPWPVKVTGHASSCWTLTCTSLAGLLKYLRDTLLWWTLSNFQLWKGDTIGALVVNNTLRQLHMPGHFLCNWVFLKGDSNFQLTPSFIGQGNSTGPLLCCTSNRSKTDWISADLLWTHAMMRPGWEQDKLRGLSWVQGTTKWPWAAVIHSPCPAPKPHAIVWESVFQTNSPFPSSPPGLKFRARP